MTDLKIWILFGILFIVLVVGVVIEVIQKQSMGTILLVITRMNEEEISSEEEISGKKDNVQPKQYWHGITFPREEMPVDVAQKIEDPLQFLHAPLIRSRHNE